MDKKFDSLEKRMDRWFYRTSRLEDRMLSLQLPHIPALEPNVTTAMEDMERRLADLEASKKEQQIGDEVRLVIRTLHSRCFNFMFFVFLSYSFFKISQSHVLHQ